MKSKILPIILIGAVMFSSCSAVYKSGQTPDDVYYSPARGIPDKEDTYEDVTTSQDNHYLRMKVRDQKRWSSLDDYTYWNDSRYLYTSNYYNPYLKTSLGYNSWGIGTYNYYNTWGWGLTWGSYNPYYYLTGWNSPFYWNNWYNPCYGVVYYKNPRAYTTTSASAVNAFTNHNYSNGNNNYYTPGYNKGNSNSSSFGNLLGRVLSTSNTNYSSSNNNNSSNNKTWDTPARTFSNSNSSSTPSSSAGGRSGGYNSSGSGSAPARTRN